ncbi:hypothetical protein CHS0354_004785 [Potamilus streckersoni]|uniref:Uncharacterized protein n=1 Tax=Potamilus streckersoni TaxID=2493646 RepID=A0AAE0TD14_9BIVA|nr:hypothetical protein CHS0354_004785 [Potamilus streckersoni]
MGQIRAMAALDTCLILTSVIGFILLVIGYSIPDWLYLTRTQGSGNESSIHMSIWYDTLCAIGQSNCRHSSSHGSLSTELVQLNNKDYKSFVDAIIQLIGDKLVWATWQALSTLSLILAFLGVIFAIVLVIYLRSHRHTYYRVFVVQGFLMMLASSTLMWIPVGMMAQVHYDLNNDLNKLSSISGGIVTSSMVSTRSPSGLIVAGVGAFLVVIAGFLFLFYPCFIETSGSESSESVREGRSHSENAEKVLSESNFVSNNIMDILLLLMTGLALVFLVLGYALPDWLYTTYTDSLSRTSTVHMSIWYNTLCPAFLPKCVTTSHGGLNHDLTNLNDTEYMVLVNTIITSTDGDLVWDAWQAMTTISVTMVFLGLILAFYLVWYVRSRRIKYIKFFAVQGFCLMLVSAVLMWVPVGMAADVNRDLSNDLSKLNSQIRDGSTASSKNLTMNAPSALILAAIGAFFASVSAVVYVCYLCRSHERIHRHLSHNSDHEEKRSSSRSVGSSALHGALIVFTILGFILLAIGYAIPDWVYVTTTVNTNVEASVHMSIWYDTLCPNTQNECVTSIHSGLSNKLQAFNNSGYKQFVDIVVLLTDGGLVWTVWQSLTTISVCLVFLGLVFAISLVCCVKKNHYKYYKMLAVQGFIFLFIANVLMWVTIGMVVDVNRRLDTAFMMLARSLPTLAVWMNLKPPSGLILAAIGTFFSFIASVIFLCYLCTSSKRRSTQRTKYYTYKKYPNAAHNISYVEDPRYIYSHGAPPAYYDQRVVEYDDQPIEYMRQSKRDFRGYDESQKITAGPSRFYRYYEYPYQSYQF